MRSADETTVAIPSELVRAGIDAKMMANRRNADCAQGGKAPKLPRRIYGVMAVTSLLTFATLKAGYQLFFATQLFA